MKMIQITEEKAGKMSDFCEKMLHYGGKLMQCLEDLEAEDEYGQRGGSYGSRIGMRDTDWDEREMNMRYGERGRARNRYGRYM